VNGRVTATPALEGNDAGGEGAERGVEGRPGTARVGPNEPRIGSLGQEDGLAAVGRLAGGRGAGGRRWQRHWAAVWRLGDCCGHQ